MTHSDAHLLTLVNLLEGCLSPAEGASMREQLATDATLLDHWKTLSRSVNVATPLDDGADVDELDHETVAAFVDGRLNAVEALAFERRCWELPAALREIVSAVRSTNAPFGQNGVPARFSDRMRDFVARECAVAPAQDAPREANYGSTVPHRSSAVAANNGRAGSQIARKEPTYKSGRVASSKRSNRPIRLAIVTALVGLVVGLATYFAVYTPPTEVPDSMTKGRNQKSGQDREPAPRNEKSPIIDIEHRQPPRIVKSPDRKTDDPSPAITQRPKSSLQKVVNRQPDPKVIDHPFVSVAWSEVAGVVAWRKVDADRWGGIHRADNNAALTGPMTVRTLPAGWLRARFKTGPEYVLDEATEARVSARHAAGPTAAGMVVRIVHRRGNVAVTRLKKGDVVRLQFAGGESELQVRSDDTTVGILGSKQALLQIIVWNGSAEFGGRSILAGQTVRWSGKRVGDPTPTAAAHRWRRRPNRKSSLRKSVVDRLNRSSNLLAALVAVNRDIPASDIPKATRLGFALDPVETVPLATSSRVEAQRIAAVQWLLAANDQQPGTQLVWQRVSRAVGPSANRLSLRRWFHAARGKTQPDAQLLRGLSAGLGTNHPVFVRQAAIHFLRHFTRLPLKEYKPDRPTTTTIDSVRRKTRRVLTSKRRRNGKAKS